jgi:predicted membrane protein
MSVDWFSIIQGVLIPVGGLLVSYFYKTSKDLRNEMSIITNDINQWKLTVVQTYATKAELEKMEARIMGALDKLDVKLDKVLGRFGHGD